MGWSIVNRNSRMYGLILGALLPVLGVVFYFYWKIYPNSWSTFLSFLSMEKRLLGSLTVICLLPNIAVFTAYLNGRRDETAKGIFAATALLAIGSLLVKWLA